MKSVRAWLMGLFMGVMLMGCTQRTIYVTSEPAGALVYLNDQEVGRTPVSVPFTHYGVYDVRLELEGHLPMWTQAEAKTPWWDHIGPDLAAEMIPGSKSEVRWHFDLAPKGEDNPEALLDRAGQLRATTRQR